MVCQSVTRESGKSGKHKVQREVNVAGINTTQMGAGLEDFTSEQLAKVDEIIKSYKENRAL
jgi:hypothetical protein